jgi:hypothetical protein
MYKEDHKICVPRATYRQCLHTCERMRGCFTDSSNDLRLGVLDDCVGSLVT